VLARAREGFYSTFEVQRGMPIHSLIRHFDQVEGGWQIKPALRRAVTFRARQAEAFRVDDPVADDDGHGSARRVPRLQLGLDGLVQFCEINRLRLPCVCARRDRAREYERGQQSARQSPRES